ncbi:MAG: ABC transporter ATP-binding protein [Anaerolineae bacterium]|nr:ABC transporter ATP-binding protein [Anaerolineae bacterium]
MDNNNQHRTIINVKNLQTHFDTLDGVVRAVNDVSLEIRTAETLGLVGESGSGKSVTAYSIMRLLSKNGRIVSGEILYNRGDGEPSVDLTTVEPDGDLIRGIRGNEIAMIFQEPLTSLSPVHTVGSQIAEAVELHQDVSAEEARDRAIYMMEQVGIAQANRVYDSYPHQFSGGMRQRAMIAMALSCNPALLIADEPTTALDVTIQAQIIELMKALQDEFGTAILVITHNLGVIAEMADRVDVMYMGQVMESGDVRSIFHRPLHPYTVGLLRSIPKLGSRIKDRLSPIPGSVPDPFSVPSGCPFYPRCPAPKRPECEGHVPLLEVESGHKVRCTLYL